MKKWGILFFVLALIGLVFWKGREAVSTVTDFITRGKKLTASDLSEPVIDLVSAAGRVIGRPVSQDAYALARMIRSEGDNSSVREKTAIAYVAINDSQALKWPLFKTLTYNKKRPAGTFGSQKGGRYATTRDPFENDLNIAEAVLTGQLPDETNGATKFAHIKSFGVQEGTGSYDELLARWQADGYSPVTLADLSTDFVLFVRG